MSLEAFNFCIEFFNTHFDKSEQNKITNFCITYYELFKGKIEFGVPTATASRNKLSIYVKSKSGIIVHDAYKMEDVLSLNAESTIRSGMSNAVKRIISQTK